jgi:hypothetical protein
MQFEKEQAEKRLQQQQQSRLIERGAVRLAASSPVPMAMLTSSMGDVVMRNSNSSNSNNNGSPIPSVDLHDVEADADTTGDSDQSLGFLIEPVSARKDCTNPVAMTLLHSDDGMEDATFLLQHDCTPSSTFTPSKSTSGSRQSPLTCSARVPMQNIARPVAERPTLSQQEQKQQNYQHDHHHQHHHHHQQQYYYQQQQAQQQQQYYQQQQQQQRPYHQYHF